MRILPEQSLNINVAIVVNSSVQNNTRSLHNKHYGVELCLDIFVWIFLCLDIFLRAWIFIYVPGYFCLDIFRWIFLCLDIGTWMEISLCSGYYCGTGYFSWYEILMPGYYCGTWIFFLVRDIDAWIFFLKTVVRTIQMHITNRLALWFCSLWVAFGGLWP